MKSSSEPRQPFVSLSYLEHLLQIKRDDLRMLARTSGRYYRPYDLHKKGTNKWRHIDSPQEPLKALQKRINKKILNQRLDLLPDGMTGGISGKSIIENAKVHIGKEAIGVIDIKDCFPSTSNILIHEVWRSNFGCGREIAQILTKLTTFQHRLPQGAPTSSLLCNFALLPVFEEITNYANSNSLNVTIFVDDITISGNKINVVNAIQPIIAVLRKHEYSVRKKKVRILTSGYSQKVTSVTVNSKLSVNRKQIQFIRELILETAKLKGYIPLSTRNHIKGKISFAKQLSKSQAETLEKFADRLLIQPTLQVKISSSDNSRSCNKFRKSHEYITMS